MEHPSPDAEWRDQLAQRLARAFFAVFLACFVIVLVTIHGAERWTLAATAAIGAAMVVGPALFDRPKGNLRAWLIVLPALAAALSGYAAVGFLSAPGTVLAMSIMLGGLLLGRRVMFVLTACAAVVIAGIAWGMVTGRLSPPHELTTDVREPVAWARTIGISFFAIGLFGALLLAVIARMERSLEIARAETVRRELAERERADAEIALLQSRQLETIGRLAAGVAHDFNNNLTAIIGCAELLVMDLPPASEQHELATDIVKASQHAASLTGQLLAYSRQAQMMLVPTDVHALIGSALSLVTRSADPRIVVTRDLASARGVVQAEPSLLQNAILNLLVNAVDAMPTGGELRVATMDRSFPTAAGLPAGRYLVIEVRDTGTGIAPEVLPRIFEPFFTSKPVRKGTGLGLAGVAATADALGGAVAVESAPGKGTSFRLRLPLPDHAVAVANEASEVLVRGTGRILVVDDEPLVRHAVVALLRSLGYEVSEAVDGAAAATMVESAQVRFDLVLLDVRMPKVSGEASLPALLAADPELRVLVWSGHLGDEVLERMLAQGAAAFVAKPYRAAQLSRTIADVMKRPRPTA